MDSPRGRIQLMEKTADGTLRLSPTVVEHFDRCLGCMACVSSCPSGVQYDRLIEETRHVVESEHRRPRGRATAARGSSSRTLPYPRRMRWALRLAPLGRALPAPAWAKPMLELAPRWRSSEQPPPSRPLRAIESQASRASGCSPAASSRSASATSTRPPRACSRRPATRSSRPPQGCCGALSAHAGRAEESARLTERLRRSFDGVDTIVVNASGCGSHLKDRGLPAVDVTEALREADAARARAARAHGRLPGLVPPPARAATARRLEAAAPADPGPDRRRARRAGSLLRLGRDLQRRPAGGRARARRPQGGHVLATGADVYASANPGCLVQVSQALGRAGTPLPALHPVELLDASLRGVGATSCVAGARR